MPKAPLSNVELVPASKVLELTVYSPIRLIRLLEDATTLMPVMSLELAGVDEIGSRDVPPLSESSDGDLPLCILVAVSVEGYELLQMIMFPPPMIRTSRLLDIKSDAVIACSLFVA